MPEGRQNVDHLVIAVLLLFFVVALVWIVIDAQISWSHERTACQKAGSYWSPRAHECIPRGATP